MSPLFSIIIPVYRSGPFLRDCLDSIRNQTLTDWECICINDGSPDESGAILDEYARKDSRFTAIHQDNRGVSAARNAGLSVAKGSWTAFVDGDDTVEPDMRRLCVRRKPPSSATESAKTSIRGSGSSARKPPSQAGTSTSPRRKRGPSCATC